MWINCHFVAAIVVVFVNISVSENDDYLSNMLTWIMKIKSYGDECADRRDRDRERERDMENYVNKRGI